MSLLGTTAPIFKAPVVMNGRDIVADFSLEQYIGQKEVILFFYPKDFTFVCPTELLCFSTIFAPIYRTQCSSSWLFLQIVKKPILPG